MSWSNFRIVIISRPSPVCVIIDFCRPPPHPSKKKMQAGGDRQELHEKVRVHSMAAGMAVKGEGKPNDLLDRVAADPAFAPVHDQLHALIDPSLFIGRSPEQVCASRAFVCVYVSNICYQHVLFILFLPVMRSGTSLGRGATTVCFPAGPNFTGGVRGGCTHDRAWHSNQTIWGAWGKGNRAFPFAE